MEPTISILPSLVERSVEVGTISNKEEKSLESFFHKFSEGAYFDTGLLPLDGTGVLSIRKGLEHTQVVFQHKPDTYLVTWGMNEHDSVKPTYKVAQPYRVVIGDIVDGNLLGARMFYSPVAIQTGDQMLYHVNLPNLNCKGYKTTGVGWMCLYHSQDWTADSFDTKVRKLVERASGAEAYNDTNMSGTDGPRFYKEFYQNNASKAFLWDPSQWQKKTTDEGTDWTLDAGLWIPVKVKSIDDQSAHNATGIPLTLEMAMLGGYKAYYTDPHQPKPVNAWARSDLPNPDDKAIFGWATKSFVTSAKKTVPTPSVPGVTIKTLLGAPATTPQGVSTTYTPPISYGTTAPVNPVVGSCYDCQSILYQDSQWSPLNGAKVCEGCKLINYNACSACEKLTHYTYLQSYGEDEEGVLYCKDCHEVYNCNNCGKQYLDDAAPLLEDIYCIDCTEYEYCHDCQQKYLKGNVHIIEAKVPKLDAPGLEEQELVLCNNCMSQSVTCGCGLIKHEEDTGLLDSGVYACATCIDYTEDGTPCFIGQLVTT